MKEEKRKTKQNIKMARPIDHTRLGVEIFQDFYCSGLHNRNNEDILVEWPSETYCMFCINGGLPVVVRNFYGKHAEIVMMENHLIGYKNVEGQVVIYMNYSCLLYTSPSPRDS